MAFDAALAAADAAIDPANDTFGLQFAGLWSRPCPQVVVEAFRDWIAEAAPDDGPVLRNDALGAMYDILGWMLARHPGALIKRRSVELARLDYAPMSEDEREGIYYLADQIEAALTVAGGNRYSPPGSPRPTGP